MKQAQLHAAAQVAAAACIEAELIWRAQIESGWAGMSKAEIAAAQAAWAAAQSAFEEAYSAAYFAEQEPQK